MTTDPAQLNSTLTYNSPQDLARFIGTGNVAIGATVDGHYELPASLFGTSRTADLPLDVAVIYNYTPNAPSPTPTATPTATPTVTPGPTATPGPSVSPTATPVPTPGQPPSPQPSPTAQPSPSPEADIPRLRDLSTRFEVGTVIRFPSTASS